MSGMPRLPVVFAKNTRVEGASAAGVKPVRTSSAVRQNSA